MKVLITAPFHENGLRILQNHPQLDIQYENWRKTGKLFFDDEELILKLNNENIEIIITEADEIDAWVIEKTHLKLIASTRGTPVNIDAEAAEEKRIPVIYTPHRNADAVADLTVGMMLSQARKIIQLDRFLRSGEFDISELDESGFAEFYNQFIGIELGGLTIGIIGFGQIGQRVAKRLHLGFGSKIIYYDPYIDSNHLVVKETLAQAVELEELMKESDLITIHTPPIEETEGLITKELFALMKPTAHFFNLARSFCIDEDALYEALVKKKIAGAGLDVFDDEPVDSDNRFLKLPNVTVMPHFGGNTQDVIRHQTEMIVSDILSFLEGKNLKYQWKT